MSFGLTLLRTSFSIISNNYDPQRDTAKIIKNIREAWLNPGFFETISFGRFFCNNITSIFLFFYVIYQFKDPFDPYTIAISFAIIISYVYLIALFLPNFLANIRPYKLAKCSWIIMKSIIWIFYIPGLISKKFMDFLFSLVGHVNQMSFLTDEQKIILESDTSNRSEDHGLEDDEKEMIKNIFDFGETPVKEIMTPRVDMTAINNEASLDEILAVFNKERHSRIPVYKESPDDIIGVLYNRDILHWISVNKEEEFALAKLLKPVFFVPRDKKIDDLMRELKSTRNQLAVVVDEYGGTSGIVTLEDVIEEIVGEIHDEDDDPYENYVKTMKDGSFLVDPVISINDLQDELDFTFELEKEHHVESLSGLIQATLGSIPQLGERIKINPLTLEILSINNQRVTQVRVSF